MLRLGQWSSQYYDQSEVDLENRKKTAQIEATGQKEVSCYCPGCWSLINENSQLLGLNVHYAIKKLLWAFGDEAP